MELNLNFLKKNPINNIKICLHLELNYMQISFNFKTTLLEQQQEQMR